MHIPANAIIQREKLTRYLLVPKPKNDKSHFLAKAGFTIENPDALEVAIRQLLKTNEAIFDGQNDYGAFYTVSGPLNGPAGVLSVVTVWILLETSGVYRFVTLKPKR
jgi:hypothetical protein